MVGIHEFLEVMSQRRKFDELRESQCQHLLKEIGRASLTLGGISKLCQSASGGRWTPEQLAKLEDALTSKACTPQADGPEQKVARNRPAQHVKGFLPYLSTADVAELASGISGDCKVDILASRCASKLKHTDVILFAFHARIYISSLLRHM